MLAGNMIFAAAENQKIENFQNVEVKASDVRQKIENEIVGKAEVEVKSFKKNKIVFWPYPKTAARTALEKPHPQLLTTRE